jgi:hypothetical protein
MPRAALASSPIERRQTGLGMGYWFQPDDRSVLGLNVSAIAQRGGYYTLVSDMADLNRPVHMLNIGAAASRAMGRWEVSLSGELTHIRMPAGQGSLSFTPANLASVELGVRKSRLLFSGQRGIRDRLGIAFAIPPRAISGKLRVDYLSRTDDGLGQQSATTMVPLSRLGIDPARVEMAYRVYSGAAWSFGLSGGLNLETVAGLGAGETMANFKLAL